MHACFFDKVTGEFIECDYEDRDCSGCKYESHIAATVDWYCFWCGKHHTTRPSKVRHFCDWTCKDSWTSAICGRWRGGMITVLNEFYSLYWENPAYSFDEYKEANKIMLGRDVLKGGN